MAWFLGHKRDPADVEDEAGVGLIEPKAAEPAIGHSAQQRHSWILKSPLGVALILSNLAWTALCLMLWRKLGVAQSPAQMGFGGFEADFVAQDPLPNKYATIRFDDLLLFNETSRAVYRQMNPELPLYFGKPSPAIDAAWDELLQYEYPAITPEEIAKNPFLSYTKDKDKHPVTGKYHFALDVFHNLHCLNMVRMELDKDYYGHHDHDHVGRRAEHGHEPDASQHQPNAWDAAQRDHIDHCMNHIRQSLQCRPDLSPAAMHVFDDFDGSKYFLGNAERHTCYDWGGLMRWAAKRKGEPGYTTPVK